MPFLDVDDIRLEYRTLPGDARRRRLVFLHEGLGSVDLWRDFPARIAEETGHPAIVYSRRGHGWSTPATGTRDPGFMHDEALETLPSVLERLSIVEPLLIGHSDGASIALIHAAHRPVAGVVALAPHVFVEPESVAGIDAARREFEETDMAERMQRYHHDPAATFHGWHGTWMSPAFRDWNIEGLLGGITCPLLLIQGADDRYGTEAQLTAIERAVPGPVRRLWLAGCGHSPHLERTEEVIRAVVEFVDRFGPDSPA
jgi:pimeloyl-ACP methyl ester carboxylesterase